MSNDKPIVDFGMIDSDIEMLKKIVADLDALRSKLDKRSYELLKRDSSRIGSNSAADKIADVTFMLQDVIEEQTKGDV